MDMMLWLATVTNPVQCGLSMFLYDCVSIFTLCVCVCVCVSLFVCVCVCVCDGYVWVEQR